MEKVAGLGLARVCKFNHIFFVISKTGHSCGIVILNVRMSVFRTLMVMRIDQVFGAEDASLMSVFGVIRLDNLSVT